LRDSISGAEFLSQHHVDLIFVDVEMPVISGFDLIKSFEKRPMVIFVTAQREFAFYGYELAAVDYILKPVDF
jgi:two-component system LytT family response regulator